MACPRCACRAFVAVAGPCERAPTSTVGDRTGAEGLHRSFDELRTSWRRNPHQMRALYVLMLVAVLPVPFRRDRMAVLRRDLRRRIESGSWMTRR
ncbi:hypothetical protein GCM10022384_26920 [Streptomyces marokkonensis]|uniref:Uncharacterized protein n=1 Tax=Streptomyces marokkonensis TaxID=324855 RepID=A0ABP7Q2T9_9ACTN